MRGFVRGFGRRLALRRILPRNFFGRALIIVGAPLVILQLILAAIFYEEHWEEVGRQLAFQFASQMELVARQVIADPAASDDILFYFSSAYDVKARYETRAVLPEARPHDAETYLDRALERMLSRKLDRPYHYDTQSFDDEVVIRVGLPGGVLAVTAPVEHVTSSTTNLFISLMMVSVAGVFVLAIYFLRQQVRPLRAVARAAERFGRGDIHAPLVPHGSSEVRQMATSFLAMRERLRAQIEQRTEMLAGVSHDLRTPITRLRLQIEMLDNVPVSARGEMETDLREMDQMIEEYLSFARGEGEEELSKTDLGTMVSDVVGRACVQGVKLEMIECEPLTLEVRPGAIRRALTNVVNNACRVAKRVQVGIQCGDDAAKIIVDDDGPGIRPGDWEEAFRPFRKLEGTKSEGVGIGLSVARDIVRGHGGEIWFSDSPLGGLRVVLSLPF